MITHRGTCPEDYTGDIIRGTGGVVAAHTWYRLRVISDSSGSRSLAVSAHNSWQAPLTLWLWREHMLQPLYEYSSVSPFNAIDITSGVGSLRWNPHCPCCAALCTLSSLSMPPFPHRWCWSHAGTLVCRWNLKHARVTGGSAYEAWLERKEAPEVWRKDWPRSDCSWLWKSSLCFLNWVAFLQSSAHELNYHIHKG